MRVAPANLALTQLEAITQQIEATYVDKARARSTARCTVRRAARCHARPTASLYARSDAPDTCISCAANALTRLAARVRPARCRRLSLGRASAGPLRDALRDSGDRGRRGVRGRGRRALYRQVLDGAWPAQRKQRPPLLGRCHPPCLTARSRGARPRATQVFFRPFIGEVLVGRIKSSDVTGLRVRSPYHARCCRGGSRALRRRRYRWASSTTCTCPRSACKSRPSCACAYAACMHALRLTPPFCLHFQRRGGGAVAVAV